MNLITLLLLAVGLSMDAFAVSICKGLAMQKLHPKHAFTVGIWFGSFQGFMPLAGYVLGTRFATYIDSFSSVIAFILLGFIGGNMIRESRSNDTDSDSGLGFRKMLLLAIATSIDALAVGITFACIPVSIRPSLSPLMNTGIGCLIIAVTTCVLSSLGVVIGHMFGARYKQKAECVGGIILIALGFKILLEFLIG